MEHFNKKLISAALPLLKMDAFSDGWKYETHVCSTCGHETYTHIEGTGKPIQWPTGTVKFKRNTTNNMETKTVSKTFNEFEDFNVGDVVRLRSGGPNMTVDNASSSRIQCVWFIEATQYRDNFDQGALEKVAQAEKLES